MANLRRQFDKGSEQDALQLVMTHDFLDVMHHIQYSTISTGLTETILIPVKELSVYEKNRLIDNYGFVLVGSPGDDS